MYNGLVIIAAIPLVAILCGYVIDHKDQWRIMWHVNRLAFRDEQQWRWFDIAARGLRNPGTVRNPSDPSPVPTQTYPRYPEGWTDHDEWETSQ